MVAAGEAPDEEASADGAVNGGADRGGADRGIRGGENMELLLSLLDPLKPLMPILLVLVVDKGVADGEDWLLEHHFHSGCFLKWSSFCWKASTLYLFFSL